MNRINKQDVKGINFIRTVSDQDCPKCGFPEVCIIRDEKTMNPFWIECSKSDCDWARKAISVQKIKLN